MWNEPYLESCCRAALHRLFLAGPIGRPLTTGKDNACLQRLAAMGLTCDGDAGHTLLTPAGTARHASEILKRPLPPPRSAL